MDLQPIKRIKYFWFIHRLTDLGGAEEKLKIERHLSTYPGALEVSLLERKATSHSDISIEIEVIKFV